MDLTATTPWKQRHGFTLIEVLVAMVIGSILITAIYQMFHSQQKSYLIQDQVAEMQQNLRAGLYMLTRDLRNAGYDPTGSGNFGFVTDFATPYSIFTPDIDYANNRTALAFTFDQIPAGGGTEDGVVDPGPTEKVAYRYNATDRTLERYNFGNTAWDTVATNVDALDFVFLDASGAVTTDPANFHAVEITVLVRTSRQDLEYTNPETYTNKQNQTLCSGCTGDHHRRRQLSTTVRLRNL